MREWGIKDEGSLRLGMWNKSKYQVISSKVNIKNKEVLGEIEVFPDSLDRPNRPPFAFMRTSPISNILTHSNYFTVLAVSDKENEEVLTENLQILKNIALSPTVQVIPIPEERHYSAIGIDQNGLRINNFQPAWSLEKGDGGGTIGKDGNFKASKDGIVYINAHKDKISKKVITFLGNCSWCHYFGKR